MATASGWNSSAAPESLGHAIGRDVVVRRPDATGGEHVRIFRTQGVERCDDFRSIVGDHPHFLQIDADRGEVVGDIADVLVLGAPRQNLVADHQHGSGDDVGLGTHDTVLFRQSTRRSVTLAPAQAAGSCTRLFIRQRPLSAPG